MFNGHSLMNAVIKILQIYKFDLGDRSIQNIATDWQKYDSIWLRSAITEAMYRGRYKIVSVEQILSNWERKQIVSCNFDVEFEHLIWGELIECISSTDADLSPSTMLTKLKSLCHSVPNTKVPNTKQRGFEQP
jgi:hypothetical protein